MDELIQFLDHSPTAWHAVAESKKLLQKNGFIELLLGEKWSLEFGKKYFVAKNGSSLCAFITPLQKPKSCRIIASHTDSPSFKIKPQGEFHKDNLVMIGTEVYGAPLLNSWLNRDLGIAGRLVYMTQDQKTCETLITIDDHPLVIPQLAIHLDRHVNDNGIVLNKQTHLSAIAGTVENIEKSYLEDLISPLIEKGHLLSHDLFLYPLERASLIGLKKEFIASYRIDNLLSLHACLKAIASQSIEKDSLKMLVAWDNEEIGSNTAQGACSPFFSHVLEMITLNLQLTREEHLNLLQHSLCASVDLAHALHPNYPEKHDPRHQPLLNCGIVLKSNAQHRYASDAYSSSVIIKICHQEKRPLQHFVARNDMPCGSTIGPIHASLTGIPTLDIGCAQLSMHASRELCGSQDYYDMCHILTKFLV